MYRNVKLLQNTIGFMEKKFKKIWIESTTSIWYGSSDRPSGKIVRYEVFVKDCGE